MFKGRDKHKIYNTNAVRHEMIELQKQTAIILPIIKDHNVAFRVLAFQALRMRQVCIE